ncbi:MAG: hypothetical protein RJB26_1146 [Pseudomonadota bacterium]|jgi:hypothetical protein
MHFDSIHRWGRGAALALLVAALPGCMTAKMDENRLLPTAIAKGEGLVILAKPVADGLGSEDEFLDCVSKQLASGANPIRVEDNNRFIDSLYPWFESSTAPTRPDNLGTLLAHPRVAERIAAQGVRYLVWVDGNTQKTDSGGSIACAVGPGGGGCLGFGWWEKQSDYQATVWDLQNRKSTGSVSANVNGTSAMIGVVLPIPLIARVQSAACDRLAGQLRTFLQGDGTAMPSGGAP